MGKWNRRYMPRRASRNYHYEDPPPSPPESYSTQGYVSRGEDHGVPAWEIDYCHSVRVPWRRVLASKNYIYCHPIVQNWDDSSGKEALQNAKNRYWAMTNGLPFDCPLPDMDMYIGEIDWNPSLDPELMADLDHPAFNPDDALESGKLETINEEEGWAQSSSNNPWESNLMQETGDLKDSGLGWNNWDDSVNLTKNNPWERRCSQGDPAKSNAWSSGKESRGWPQGIDNTALRQEGWGRQDNNNNNNTNNSWHRDCGGSRNFGDCGFSGHNKCFTGSRGRGWQDDRNKSWGRNDNTVHSSGWRGSVEYNGNEPTHWDSQGFRMGGRSSRGGYRKRESSVQHTAKFKSSRYYNDSCRNSRWQ